MLYSQSYMSGRSAGSNWTSGSVRWKSGSVRRFARYVWDSQVLHHHVARLGTASIELISLAHTRSRSSLIPDGRLLLSFSLSPSLASHSDSYCHLSLSLISLSYHSHSSQSHLILISLSSHSHFISVESHSYPTLTHLSPISFSSPSHLTTTASCPFAWEFVSKPFFHNFAGSN
jgi:hypothetical protein